MSNLATKFVAVAILSLAVGLIGRNNGIVDGLGKAFFGVFMILFFITRFFGQEKV
jgi:hypothetical protein